MDSCLHCSFFVDNAQCVAHDGVLMLGEVALGLLNVTLEKNEFALQQGQLLLHILDGVLLSLHFANGFSLLADEDTQLLGIVVAEARGQHHVVLSNLVALDDLAPALNHRERGLLGQLDALGLGQLANLVGRELLVEDERTSRSA